MGWPIRRRKYGNKSARCLNKTHAIHQSMFEADICNELFAKWKEKIISHYDTQKKLELRVNDVHITNHYVDFVVYNHKGEMVEFVEAKGMETDIWRVKRNLTIALYPEIPYHTRYYRKERR